jgi:hypothetical protein
VERVGRRRFVAVGVGLVEGRAVVLGRGSPWVTTRVVGYGRRIVHDGWSERTDWSLDMQVLDGLAPARDHDIGPAPDRHLPRAEGREHSLSLGLALPATRFFYQLTKSQLLFLQQIIDLFIDWSFFWHAAQITMAVSPCSSQC